MEKQLLIVLLFFLLNNHSVVAQSVKTAVTPKAFQILSPAANDTVVPDQFILVVKLPVAYAQKYTAFKVILNDVFDLSELIKIKGNQLSVLYLGVLPPDYHQLVILARPIGEKEFIKVARVNFQVLGKKINRKWQNEKTISQGHLKDKEKNSIHGSISLFSKDAFLSGQGTGLRQEPSSTREGAVKIDFQTGDTHFPVEGQLTSNAQGDYTFRNSWKAGIIHKRLSFLIGDHYPEEDRLILSGIRIRGIAASVPFGKQQKIVAIAGRSVDDLNNGLNPGYNPNTADLYSGGLPRYPREYLFLKVFATLNQDIYSNQLSFLKSRDVFSEQIGGLTPKENIVVGSENFISMFKKRARLDINIALSVLTNDVSKPSVTDDFGSFFKVNSSTIPLAFAGLHSLAARLAYQWQITKVVSLQLEAKRIGASYYSLGTPYMLNNRLTARIATKWAIIPKKIFLSTSYEYLKDNLVRTEIYSHENHSLAVSAMLTPASYLPTLSLGYRNFLRITYGEGFNKQTTISSGIFGSLLYQKKTGSFMHSLSISRNDQRLISEVQPGSTQQANDLVYSLSVTPGYGIDLQGALYKFEVNGNTIPQTALSARLWFQLTKLRTKFAFRLGRNQSMPVSTVTETRDFTQISADFSPSKKLLVGFVAGSNPFKSTVPAVNYDERFIQVRAGFFF